MKIIILLMLILLLQCYSQNPEWINLTNGDRVYDLLSFKNNLWIGTDGGLVKLNKTTEEISFYNRANAALPDNHIRSIAIDSSGNLWLGTQYNGVGKFYDDECLVFNSANSPLPFDQWNTEIEIDAEGRIWIGSLRWISIFDGTDWASYETDNPASSFTSINDIFFDSRGDTWIGASWGLGKFINNSVTEKYDGFDKEINVIQEDTKNDLWIGTHYDGLYKYDGVNWSLYDTTNSALPANNIYDMKFDEDGNLWIATSKGLVKFNGNNWEIYNTSNSGLPDDMVLSIEIDEDGIIWIGLFNSGLIRYDGFNWKRYNLSNSRLPSNSAYAIAINNQNNVLISMNGTKSLINYNNTNWVLYDTSNSGLLNTISAMAFDNTNNLWLGYEPGKNSWLGKYINNNWTYFNSTQSPLSETNVYCMKSDADNNLWIGCAEGLIKLSGTDWTVYNSNNTPLTSSLIYDIDLDKNNNLWCAVGLNIIYDDEGNPAEIMEGALAKFDGVNWTIFNTDNSALPMNNVGAVAVDSRNIIWIATWHEGIAGIEYGGGLTKFDGTNWHTYNISNSPVTSNTIFDIEVDKDDNLWLSTCAGGLIKFDGKNNWTIYNTSNSGIAFDSQNLVAIDTFDNKWIGHNESGISLFREDGVILTVIKDDKINDINKEFSLEQNYPNPFNPSTTITYSVMKSMHIKLNVYDILGREIKMLVNEEKKPGTYKIKFNADNLSSGIYCYRLIAGNFSDTKKFVLLK